MKLVLPPINFKKFAGISGAVLVFGILFGYVIFPFALKALVMSQVSVAPGTDIRELYVKTPFFIGFRVNIFNLTNKEQVIAGGKPILQEIGPFFFEEWKEKYDLKDDEKEDTLTYHAKNTFIFRKDLSGPGLTGDEIITIPHPVIMNMGLAVNVDRKPMLSLVAKAINILFHEPQDAFWTGRIMDLLYDGIPIDCSSDDFIAQATCGIFGDGDVKSIQRVDDHTFKFSFFGGANATDLGEYRVFRGKKNTADLGRMVSYDDETEMNKWDGDECNQYVGTDSTIFPPFMKKEEGLWGFEPTICRSLGATYRGPSKYMGVPTLRYEMDLSDEGNSKQCFCRDPPNGCPVKGTIDLFRCVGSPLIASLPHFYSGDSSLLEKFDGGLNPKKEQHGVYVHFEIMSGTPLSAAKRLQFNMEIVPLPQIPIMKDLQPMIYPLFWVEESVDLNQTYVNILKKQLFAAIKFQDTVKWLCIVVGALGFVAGAILHYMKETGSMAVQAFAPNSQAEQNIVNDRAIPQNITDTNKV